MDGPFADADTSCETVINSYQIYHNYNAELQTPYTLFGPSSSFHRIEMEKVNLENHSIKNDHAMINNESLLRGPDTHIRIDDEDFSIGSVTENGAFILNQNVQNNVPVDYVPKDTFSDTDSLLNNQHENRSLHSDQNEVNSDDKSDELKGCSLKDVVKTDSSREESKHSEPEPKPSLTSFLSMENSNNAIDNNFHNEIISENSIPIVVSGCNYAVNHIFKLPKNDLTFNGTLKRLKNLNPIKNSIDTDIGYTAIGNDCNSEINNSKLDCNTYNETMEISKNDTPQTSFHLSSEELSKPLLEGDHLNLETSNKHIGILSPKETDDRLDNVSSPKDNDTTLKDMEKTYVNSSKESLNNSFDSGAHSPELFSFEDDISEPVCLKMKFIMKQFEKSDNTIIKKLEKTLQGVLPPPSVTISQLTATEILELYQKNLPIFNEEKTQTFENVYDSEASNFTTAASTPPRHIEDLSSEPVMVESFKNAFENTITETFDSVPPLSDDKKTYEPVRSFQGFLCNNADEEMVKNTPWPQILHCRYYSVHYNSTIHSEQVDCLLSKYISRFVGCETASSCIAIHNNNSSRLKRPSKAPGYSPGRRLSHLARRRTAFCNAMSLHESSTQLAKKQILIDRKKFANVPGRSRWKSPRNKRTPGRRTPGRKTPGKKTPSSSQKKRAIRRSQIAAEQPTRETSKRALFMSPDETIEECKPSTSRAVKSKRALFGSPKSIDQNTNESDKGSVSRKRERSEDDDLFGFNRLKPKVQKSFSFSGDKTKDSFSINTVQSITRRASECLTSKGELSDIHRKKLLWAVAEALRGHKIVPASEDFKQHATTLVRLVRKLCILPSNAQALRTPMTSTSETLLRIAKQHVFAVIKGKSVDEIFKEEQCKQTTIMLSKVSGYVPPTTSLESTKSSSVNKNSENSYGDIKCSKIDHLSSAAVVKSVLQDKTVNIDSRSNGSNNIFDIHVQKKNVLNKESAMLRARRQISFDNVDDRSNR